MYKYRTHPPDCNGQLTVTRREITLDRCCKVMNTDGRSQHLSGDLSQSDLYSRYLVRRA